MKENVAANNIEKTLVKFAESFNTANTKAIYDAYSKEGQYIPPKANGIWSPEIVKIQSEKFFESKTLAISFELKSVVIENGFAFANAISESKIISKNTGLTKVFQSKDFFVFRNEPDGWKIFRYMFETKKPEQ